MNKPSVVIPLSILIGGAIVAFAVYATLSSGEVSTGSGNAALITPVSAQDHIYGNPAAPVKIIEYADFDCEYCKQFDTTMRSVMAEFGASGEVAWIFRDFPITELHPNASHAAEAAECVAQVAGNDAYWRFSAALFAGQPVDPSDYLSLAKAAGADPTAVGTCEENGSSTVDAIIDADSANARAIGAQGTPSSVLEAPGAPPVVINGAWPYAAVEQAIQQALQSISSSTTPS
ncbi:MAG: DsbA family protein [Minisyncoccia bacterium]